MPSYILRKLDPDFWGRVQAKAKADGVSVRDVILQALTRWLGAPALVLVLVVLTTACASPLLEPAPLAAAPALLTPTAIVLTGGTATSVDEVLLNLRVADADGRGVPNQTVTLTTTAGTFNHATVQTGPTGTAQAMLTTDTDATVTATSGTLTATATARQFPDPPPPGESIPAPPPPVVPPPVFVAPTPVVPPVVRPPAYDVILIAAPTSVAVGGSSQLTAIATPVDGAPAATSYEWDCDGNGTIDAGTPLAAMACTYPTAGPVTSTVTARGAGATGIGRVVVTVTAAPVSPLTATLTCTLVNPTPCNVTVSYAGRPVVLSTIAWVWGDGNTDTGTVNPVMTHPYAQAGTYTVFVTVTADVDPTAGVDLRSATTSTTLLIP